MRNSKLIVKLATLIGYLLFAGFSAYFTATSLWLNLLNGSDTWTMWLVFVLVLIVSILAGMCLTNVIKELKNRVRPSRSAFVLNFLGFFIFWTFSFMTNVHYFFVEKHGFSILSKELVSAKHYIEENTSKSNQLIDEQKNTAEMAISAQVHANLDAFDRELNNTIVHNKGFGEVCINILNATEDALAKDSKTYNDKNTYVIYDDERDAGDRGVTTRARFTELRTKYATRMAEQLKKKLAVIENFYENKKDQNAELTELLEPISELENKHLPAVEKDGSVNAYYKYNSIQDARVMSKMPNDYRKKCIIKKGDKIIKYNTYPSKRMFDTMSVWGDITSGLLADMTMIQWIIIALIFDVVSFILFTIFRNQ